MQGYHGRKTHGVTVMSVPLHCACSIALWVEVLSIIRIIGVEYLIMLLPGVVVYSSSNWTVPRLPQLGNLISELILRYLSRLGL